jgi:hypothetical protein
MKQRVANGKEYFTHIVKLVKLNSLTLYRHLGYSDQVSYILGSCIQMSEESIAAPRVGCEQAFLLHTTWINDKNLNKHPRWRGHAQPNSRTYLNS